MQDIVAYDHRTNEELQIQANAPKLMEAASCCSVWDETSANEAADIAKLISAAIKVAEDERKKIVQPFNEGVKAINARFKKLVEPLSVALADVKGKLLHFSREQDKLRRAQAEAAVVSSAECVPSSDVVPVAPVTKGNFGTASIRKTWTFRVVDKSKVRLDLLMINEDAVRELIREGAREEPGLEIFQAETLVVR